MPIEVGLLDGVVAAPQGFGGAEIKCSDGITWVIDYQEQSPLHLFANRRVLAWGPPFEHDSRTAHRIAAADGGPIKHFSASRVQLVEPTHDVDFVEIGPPQQLCGTFGGGANRGESMRPFTTESGDTFLVANIPPGRRLVVVSR